MLELTHFVGDSRYNDDENLLLLMDTLQDGIILTDCFATLHRRAAMRFVEPCPETMEALGASGYGLGFAPDFFTERGYMKRMEVNTQHPVHAGTTATALALEPVHVWVCETPVLFDIEDVQTLYVRSTNAVATLRQAFPGYAGTFVVL